MKTTFRQRFLNSLDSEGDEELFRQAFADRPSPRTALTNCDADFNFAFQQATDGLEVEEVFSRESMVVLGQTAPPAPSLEDARSLLQFDSAGADKEEGKKLIKCQVCGKAFDNRYKKYYHKK